MVRPNRGPASPCRGANRSIRGITGEATRHRFRRFERESLRITLFLYWQSHSTPIYGPKLRHGKLAIDARRPSRSRRGTGAGGRPGSSVMPSLARSSILIVQRFVPMHCGNRIGSIGARGNPGGHITEKERDCAANYRKPPLHTRVKEG